MTCAHCLAAQTDPDYPGTSEPNGDCKGCEIREWAKAPRRKREQRLAEVLSQRGEAAMQSYRKVLRAEYDRINELRGKV